MYVNLKRNYYILVAAMIAMQITVSTIYMVLPIFFSNYGVDKSESGILIAIGTFAGIISSVLAGRYADSHGRKPVLLVGIILYTVVFFLFAILGRDFNSFLVLRFIEGFGYYMTPVAITAMAADSFPKKERGQAMSLYTVSNGIGQMIGPVFAGLFIDAANFNTYFLFCGIFVGISAIIILFFVKETLPTEVKKNGHKSGHTLSPLGIWKGIKNLGPVVGIFFIAVVIYRTGNTMVNPFFSLYLRDELKLDMTSMSTFFAVRALATLIVAPIAGRLSDRIGRKPIFLSGIVALTLTMLGYTYVKTYEQVLIVRILESISNAILMPTTRVYVADLMTPENRGFGMGLYMTIMDEASTMGAIFGGYIADLYSYTTIFQIGASTAVTCLAIVLSKVPEPSQEN